MEQDSSNSTTIPVLLEQLPNNPSLETTNSSSQGPKPLSVLLFLPPQPTIVAKNWDHFSVWDLYSTDHLGNGVQVVPIPFHFPDAQMVMLPMGEWPPTLANELALETLGVLDLLIWTMKILIWNCRRVASESFKRHVMDLKGTNNPCMMLITKTKVARDRAKAIASHLYPNYHVVDADGFASGLWLLWDASQISIDIIINSDQAIHAIVKICRNLNFGPSSGKNLGPYLSTLKAFGMNDCQMLDLGFIEERFTWVNMQLDDHVIRERLDRVWCNADWKLYFSEAFVFHLPRVHSDHNPLLLDLEPFKPSFCKHPFQLEKFRMEHLEFQTLVQDCWGVEDHNTSQCLEAMLKKAKLWSHATSDNLFKRKKQILAHLEGIHRFLSMNNSSFLTSLEKDLANEYSKILKLEEDLWFMKSRINWILDGDRNSRFFHVTTLKHRSHNKILGLKDAVGVWTYEPLDLHHLANLPIEDEIWMAVTSFKPFKASRPDGFIFFSIKDSGRILKLNYVQSSSIIRNLKKGNEPFLQGIKWISVDGNSISFWKDCWLFDPPLNSILFRPLSSNDEDLWVVNVFSFAAFNSSLISDPLFDTILKTIKANPISKIGLGNDSYSWKGSRDGSFSMKVAYLMAKGVNINRYRMEMDLEGSYPTKNSIFHLAFMS
ncbi:hypothetical protein SLEP1_g12219 [Rubroshorea leprosula]|uniref:Uncharacterized protein n=1 Tax=Rubroshorea leprosula TaxID=152421 RepID=A0AAV5IJS1_9ROSI|nr:hypothetical protein SLEP1_g12219 [Rubroshorea leprosula]